MRRIILTLLLLSLGLVATLAQSPLGMNYQAVIRDVDGKIIASKEIGIQISILKESTSGVSVYTETFTPITNEFGLINLVISKGQVISGEYSSIDWSSADYFLKVELDVEGGTSYKDMGTSQLLSVPYANYAFKSASSWNDAEGKTSTQNKVEIASDGKTPELPLFEVKNAKGEIIFAVYENGVEIYLDEEAGGGKNQGGFAISGRTTTKATKELVNVTPNETTIYVDEPTAKNRGGFAISGRTTTKEGGEILLVTPSLTQFFVDETTTKNRGGFAISGRTTTKAPVDLLNITPSLTQFYVDEPTAKNRGGFAISGRTTTKEGEADIFTVTPTLTEVFVDEPTAKNRGGFAISGRTTTKVPVELLNMTPSLTQFYVEEPSTKNRGGFAISGRTTTKAPVDLLNMTPSLTQFYVEEPSTKNRGGFAISGRTTTKEGEADILTVTPNLTQVYVNETTTKNRGGFAISGRTTTKETSLYDVFTVVPERTDIYVKPSNNKNSLPIGFGVHGLSDNTLESTEFFSISGLGTYIATSLAVLPKVTTGIIRDIEQTLARGGGLVLDAGGANVEITASGIVYHIDGPKLLTIEEVKNLAPDKGGMISGGNSLNFDYLEMLNLTPGTKYKVRAFATNSDGLTGYGSPREFKTLPANIVTINITDGTNPVSALVTLWQQGVPEPMISPLASTHTLSLPSGTYTFKVEADGYISHTNNNYEVVKDQTEEITLTLATENMVRFIAKNQYEKPVDSVSIQVLQNIDLTNSAGIATLYLPVGRYIPSVYVPINYDNFTINDSITVIGGSNPPIQLTLLKKHKVKFIINNSDGSPAYMTYVTLTETGGAQRVENINIDYGTGEIFLPSDADGEWKYEVASEIGVLANGTIIVGEQDIVEKIQFQAPPTVYTIKFTITDGISVPIDGAKVILNSYDLFNNVKISGDNDLQGQVTFTEVPASHEFEYIINIEKEGYQTYVDFYYFNEYSQAFDPLNPGMLNFEIVLTPIQTP